MNEHEALQEDCFKVVRIGGGSKGEVWAGDSGMCIHRRDAMDAGFRWV